MTEKKKSSAPNKADVLLMLEEEKRKNKELKERLKKVEDVQPERQEKALGADDLIDVVNLNGGIVTISTKGFGRGVNYNFSKFGEKKPIPYGHMLQLIEHNRSFFEGGLIYIKNSHVVKRHGLTEAYDSILSEEKMKAVLDCNDEASVDLYQIANPKQKEIIDRILIRKIVDGGKVDLNIVSKMSRVDGGSDIVKIAEDKKRKKSKE